jgi:rubredoxin
MHIAGDLVDRTSLPGYDAAQVLEKGASDMSKWQCVLCGYVYDPEEGDPSQGIDPGTDFEDLPDDWECPECGAGKEDFEKIED